MKLGENPTEPEILTRDQMEVGMRVMRADGKMPGKITAISDEGVSVLFDDTSGPMNYKWENANFLVREV